MTDEFDDPAILAELRAAHDRYEAALVTNDVDTLQSMFWDDERVVRYGHEGGQFGATAVDRYRRSLPFQTLPRTLRRVQITAYGADAATVAVEFIPEGHPDCVGRQVQTWIRVDAGWRVAAAHVSWEGGRAPSQS